MKSYIALLIFIFGTTWLALELSTSMGKALAQASVTPPSTPAAGRIRQWTDVTDGETHCMDSTGKEWKCVPANATCTIRIGPDKTSIWFLREADGSCWNPLVARKQK